MTPDDASSITTRGLPLASVLTSAGEGLAPADGPTCSVGGMICSAVTLPAWNSSWLSPVGS